MASLKHRILAILIMAMIAGFVLGCSSDSKSLRVSPKSLDFMDVYIGDKTTIDVVLTNKYGKDMNITSFAISGSSDYVITSSTVTPLFLLKGAEVTITVQFEPSTAGSIIGLLSITHDQSTKIIEIDLSGVGVAVARMVSTDTSYDFQKKLINKTHTHDFEIKNTGTADLVISNISFTGTGSGVFTASSTPITIVPGTSDVITVTFSPTVIGQYPVDLQIGHNAVNETSPYVIPITAEAIDVDPRITLSQTSPWDLGSVALTIPTVQICEIENTGIDPLTVTSATLNTGSEFTIDSLTDTNGNPLNFPQIIAVGAKILLYVRFAPSSKTTFNDTLSFVHDGTNENSPMDIALEGEGRDEVTQTFAYTGGVVNWTVPARVHTIICEAWGAGGEGGYGGKGARMKGTFIVTPGDSLDVMAGGNAGYASGGDGSYVALGSTLYIMAGGAGGSRYSGASGKNGEAGQNGSMSYQVNSSYTGGAAGSNGQGGTGGPGAWGTGGGGGWLSAGGNATGTTGGVIKGGGSDGTTYAGGAGGGYSGGGGCAMDSGWSTAGGGGGGSYNSGTNTSNAAGVKTGPGEVKITY